MSTCLIYVAEDMTSSMQLLHRSYVAYPLTPLVLRLGKLYPGLLRTILIDLYMFELEMKRTSPPRPIVEAEGRFAATWTRSRH